MKVWISLVILGCCATAAPTPDPAGSVNAVTGDVHTGPDGVIRTGRGMAEVLLTPGNFLRVGNATRITLKNGKTARVDEGVAMLESLDSSGPVEIDERDVRAFPHGPGLFEFDRKRSSVIVFAGVAELQKGAARVTVTKGFEADARSLKIRPMETQAGDALYAWASYRSEQLSSESAAVQISDLPRGDRGQPLWLKIPWANSYTFVSPSGYVNSPFGWPFYAPGYSHNYVPFPNSGDSYLYGPPVVPLPSTSLPSRPAAGDASVPRVPLTPPGVPGFPSSR